MADTASSPKHKTPARGSRAARAENSLLPKGRGLLLQGLMGVDGLTPVPVGAPAGTARGVKTLLSGLSVATTAFACCRESNVCAARMVAGAVAGSGRQVWVVRVTHVHRVTATHHAMQRDPSSPS